MLVLILIIILQQNNIKIETNTIGNKKNSHSSSQIQRTEFFILFDRTPLIKLNSSDKENSVIKYYQLRDKFISDMNIYTGKKQNQNIEISEIFFKTLVGVTAHLTMEEASYARRMGYVKAVYLNKKNKLFKIQSSQTKHKIKQYSGLTGKNILIGVLDTGIDYTHIALGNGIGTGFKIIGGYDFVNDDSDPIDDNGHGTHVAGIIAANGDSLKGIAPLANLMSLKVLDELGNGTQSIALRALEYAVDPNGDFDFSDKCDVLNLSFGTRNGDEFDFFSQAVDNVVISGVVVVCAAGNYFESRSIASPATAINAITVGSVNENNAVSSFSSKGPTFYNFLLKPDIVYYGENIYSLGLQNTYKSLSGTSQAAPVIAGYSALILESDSTLNPFEVKSKLVQSAHNLNYRAIEQGNGLARLENAILAKTFVNPTNISFGLITNSIINQERTIPLKIMNTSNVSVNYELSNKTLMSWVNIILSESNFTLNQDDSIEISITIQIDNNMVSYSDDAYEGMLELKSTNNDTIILNYSFSKPRLLRLQFDDIYPEYVISSNDRTYYSNTNEIWSIDGTYCDVIIDKGQYSGLFYKSVVDTTGDEKLKIILKKNINVDGSTEVQLNYSESTNRVDIKTYDEIGQNVNAHIIDQNLFFIYPYQSNNTYEVIPYRKDYFYINSFANSFQIEALATIIIYEDQKYYSVQMPTITEITADFEINNLNNKMYSYFLNLPEKDEGEIDVKFTILTGLGRILKKPGFEYLVSDINRIQLDDQFDLQIPKEILLSSTENDSVKTTLVFDSEFIGKNITTSVSMTKYVWPVDEQLLVGKFIQDQVFDFFIDVKDTINVGQGLIFNNQRMINKSNQINPQFDFIGTYGERINFSYGANQKPYYLSIFKNGNLFYSDSNYTKSVYTVEPDKYTLKFVNKNNRLLSQRVDISTELEFNLNSMDKNPPRINAIFITDKDNRVITHLKPFGEYDAHIVVNDFGFLNIDDLEGDLDDKKTELQIRFFSTENNDYKWQTLAFDSREIFLQNNEQKYYRYTVDISKFSHVDSAAISFRLKLFDINGNSSIYTLEPGIAVGHYTGGSSIINNLQEILNERAQLWQNYPNPFSRSTIFRYYVPKAGEIRIKIYNLLGQVIHVFRYNAESAGFYQYEWYPGRIMSGVYFAILETISGSITKKALFLK
ncbi:MAG: S8 family serine peptidase [Calditrichaeota bacterium]|nr:S8 family serine peptidase [Calditrichota bacterium]